MSLTALPPELITYVVANIESLPTLCNLARCSRQLYLCTIPHLYHHVTVQEEVPLEERQDGQLQNLASLLIRRQDLAGLVRQFTFHVVRLSRMGEGSSDESETFEEIKEFLQLEEPKKHFSPKIAKVDRVFKTAIKASSLSKEEENNWLSQFGNTHRCHFDLILPLLLPALFNVEKLVLDMKYGSDTQYLERMMRRAVRREKPFEIQPPFTALTVFVHSHNMSKTQSTRFIASLVKLPAIQKISGAFGYAWDDDLWDDWDDWDDDLSELRVADKNLVELDSSSSPLTSLDLGGYAMNAADLGRILRAPQALKTFSYSVRPPACFNFTQIRHALGGQEDVLERLSLDYAEKYYGVWYAHVGRRGVFGPMTSFVSFKTLKVFKTAALFLEVIMTGGGTEPRNLLNVFPSNLQTLHLTRFQACYKSLLEALEHLLARKSPQQIPSLRKLIIEEAKSFGEMRSGKLMDVLWKGTHESAIATLSTVAAIQGVSVEVIELSDDEASLVVREWRSDDDESSDSSPTHSSN